MAVSIESENHVIQCTIVVKILRKLGTEGDFLNLIHSIYELADIIPDGERLNAFP